LELDAFLYCREFIAHDIDLDALAARYADPGYWRQALDEGDEGTLT